MIMDWYFRPNLHAGMIITDNEIAAQHNDVMYKQNILMNIHVSNEDITRA